MLETIDLSGIQDENARQLIVRLLNLIEDLSADLRDAQAEVQRLQDEANRLKGEQGKPDIKANKPKPPRFDHSSETERRKPKPREKRHKKARLQIHREQTVEVGKVITATQVRWAMWARDQSIGLDAVLRRRDERAEDSGVVRGCRRTDFGGCRQ